MSNSYFRENRQIVETNMREHGMTLSEALVDFLDAREIPHEKFRQHFEASFIERIKSELRQMIKGHPKHKPMFLGFIKG